MRADLNVPLDKSQKITDDTRIRAAIPTLKYLVSACQMVWHAGPGCIQCQLLIFARLVLENMSMKA